MVDIEAIRARLKADCDARIDAPDGEPRCAVCDGECTGESEARKTLLEYAPRDLMALCDEVERRRAQFERGRIAAERLAETAQSVDADNARLRAEVARFSRWLDRSFTPENAFECAMRALASDADDAPNCMEYGASITRPDGTKRLATVSVQWVDGKTPHQLLAERTAERDFHQHKVEEWEESAGIERKRAEAAEADRDALRAENAGLREIIAGRTTAPTDAEVSAHAPHGRWKALLSGNRVYLARRPDESILLRPDTRWWAVDEWDTPCAWPVVRGGGDGVARRSAA